MGVRNFPRDFFNFRRKNVRNPYIFESGDIFLLSVLYSMPYYIFQDLFFCYRLQILQFQSVWVL